MTVGHNLSRLFILVIMCASPGHHDNPGLRQSEMSRSQVAVHFIQCEVPVMCGIGTMVGQRVPQGVIQDEIICCIGFVLNDPIELIAKAQWIERYPKRTKTGFELEIAKSLVKFVRKATAKAKNLICVVNGKG